MSYNKMKYIGAFFWGLTYICFILIGSIYEYAMIPLIVCSYNMSYELLYTVLADSKGQRFRNGLWFLLDCFVVYYHICDVDMLNWFFFLAGVMFIIQIVTTFKISKETTKSFAWIVTCIMAIWITLFPPEFYSNIVVFAMIFKSIGDGFYGIAHLSFGIPNSNKINKLYLRIIYTTIIFSFVLNMVMILTYI